MRFFDFDSDESADDLDELQISNDYSNEDKTETDSMNGSYTDDSGFTSISPRNITPISEFRSFFTKDILN